MAWTSSNPVSIGAPTKKSHYDALWDNCDFFKTEHNTDGTHKYPLTAGTVVASTSGVAIDFTSIPAWVKRITVNLNGISTNGTSAYQIQLGDSGGVETSGYDMANEVVSGGYPGGVGGLSYTSGFVIAGAGVAVAAAGIYSGQWVFTLLDAASFLWIGSGAMAEGGVGRIWLGAGKKALSAALDRIRITTVNGTDAFDAGAINILYE